MSITNQETRIRAWAADHGHDVVAVTRDRATSGGVPARDRAELGPWLRDKASAWDILVTAKLDRGFRSVLDFAQVKEWADRHGKKLVSIAESYDLTTPEGELMANQLVAFAQFERRRAGTRRAESGELITLAGRWDGGRVPFGYTPVGSPGNYRLAPHPQNADVVRTMAADAMAGKSLSAIARDLNDRRIRTSLGRTWRDNSVRRVLTSPALLGQSVRMQGSAQTVLRDRDGHPVMITDAPLLDEQTFRRLQATITGRGRARIRPQARHLLYGVAFCRPCSLTCDRQPPCPEHSRPLYGHRRVKDPAKRAYYSCHACGSAVRLDVLEDYAERFIKLNFGNRLLLEQVTIPGDDHAAEIARLARRADRLRTELDDDPDDADLARSVARTEAKIADLRALPHEPDRIDWVPVEPRVTVADHWDAEDTAGRNRFLRRYEVRLFAAPDGISTWGPWESGEPGTFGPPPSEW